MAHIDGRVQLSGGEDSEAEVTVMGPCGLADSMELDDEGEPSSDDEFTQEILRAIKEGRQTLLLYNRPLANGLIVHGSDGGNEEDLAVDLSGAASTAAHQPPEEQLFHVRRNTARNFKVCRHKGASVPRWKDMKLKTSVELQGVELRQGNLISVVVLGQNDAIAEVAEIRAVGDGRHLLRVFWFLERDMVIPGLDDANRAKFPPKFAFVKAAYTDVISWITTRGPLDSSSRAKILPDRILCYWGDRRTSLELHTAPDVRWARCRGAAGRGDSGRPCEPHKCGPETDQSDRSKFCLLDLCAELNADSCINK